MDMKDHWDLDTALKVVQNKTVDSKLWAEAVEWLLLYGPPEIVSILLQASSHATDRCFPEIQPMLTDDGKPVYDLAELAKSLEMTEDEVKQLIRTKEGLQKTIYFLSGVGNETVH